MPRDNTIVFSKLRYCFCEKSRIEAGEKERHTGTLPGLRALGGAAAKSSEWEPVRPEGREERFTDADFLRGEARQTRGAKAVSYTHLTLPTIYSV